ncbi:ARM repeat-containing protein [Aureobasidium subglaciale]|nr:ARM repeat-containing protein [Aureobasidium subglaciale]
MERRNEAFQRLKPICIALSQSILAFASNRRNADSIIQALETLSKTLEDITSRPDAFDHKLADYVFFPISQVLKASRDLPVQAMEACLRCLSILISKGWTKSNIDQDLSGQLLIFLTLTCDTSGKAVPTGLATDELRAAGFQCMQALFQSLSTTSAGKASLVGTTNVPSLGHAVSVILEGVVNGESFQVQLAAADALQALVACIDDLEVLSSFLPGIVSSWTKALTPNTKGRRHWRVLVAGLHVIGSLLRALLGDNVVKQLSTKIEDKTAEKLPMKDHKITKLDESWVKATAAQLKVAISNINRLRKHERQDVQEAVLDFNLTLLSECSHALADSCALAAETVLLLMQSDTNAAYRDKIAMLAQNNSAISDLLSTVFRNEQISLVRIMQSNDDQAKERSLGKLFGAYTILAGTEVDMSMITRMLGTGLKDSVTTVLQQSVERNTKTARVTPVAISDMSLQTSQKSLTFTSPLAEYKSQEVILDFVSRKLKSLKGAQASLPLASDLMPALRTSDKTSQVATLWLILQDLRNDHDDVDGFMNDMLVGDLYSRDQSVSLREQLYSFSLDVLEDDDSVDWRLKSLALEAVALHAQRLGVEFKDELVEALYPILHHLGSDSGYVRNHAMTCLNIVADSCSYSDAGELIVSNVDYLVNAVALKLNAFDISPQAPQVLLMMVRLAGPSLLPYLEDTLESIFAALEDYHGYTSLVELLFAVLRTMAEEGVKSPLLAITGDSETGQKDSTRWKPLNLTQLIEIIQGLSKRPVDDLAPPTSLLDPEEEDATNDQVANPEPTEPQPPSPKTYSLLLKITQLTQHYLTSSSPSLRTSLFSLLRTTIPTLARHENSFLPLINTLWPEVTSRLFDEEVFVVSGSLDIIAMMCEYSGSFMRTRIDALWPELTSLHKRVTREIKSGMQKSQQNTSLNLTTRNLEMGYVDPSTRSLWKSLEGLFISIVEYVEVDAEKFDDVLRILGPIDDRMAEKTRKVLEGYNGDAVWLAQYRAAPWELKKAPQKSRFAFARVA